MKKRLLSLVLTLLLILGLCSTAFAAEGTDNFRQVNTYTEGQFTDVNAGQWYAPTVRRAYELGLMKGTSGTSFSPNGTITLAETLALACRLHSTYYNNGAQFVQGSVWYQVYVDYAVTNGIIAAGAYESYTAKATRADFVTILAASMPASALPAINTVEDGTIPDLGSGDGEAVWNAAYLLYRAGVLTGSDEYGTFKPYSSITRSEVAAIVVRMADASQRKSVTLAEWPENGIENIQGSWSSAFGNIELVVDGNHWTYTEADTTESGEKAIYYFFQGVTGQDLRQKIYIRTDEAGALAVVYNRACSDRIAIICCGNVLWVSTDGEWGYFCYRTAETPMTERVYAELGDSVLNERDLTSSAVTDLKLGDSTSSVGLGGNSERVTAAWVTVGGRELQTNGLDSLAWKSSNPEVAAIDTEWSSYGCWIFGKAEGTATITATINGLSEGFEVTVVPRPESKVEYISDRYVWDYDGYYTFAFSFKDASYTRISSPAYVDIRIVNDNGETVYDNSHYISEYSFGQWTYRGETMLLASIRIYDEYITPGSSDKGTLYYQIYDQHDGYFFTFSEYSLDISDLPLKETTLELPELPQTIHYFNYDDSIRNSYRITAASYQVDGTRITVKLSGEKIYDVNGSGQSDACRIGWKLYDSEGYVVDSGTCYSSSVAMGEKFRNAEIHLYDLEIGGDYRLVLTNVN